MRPGCIIMTQKANTRDYAVEAPSMSFIKEILNTAISLRDYAYSVLNLPVLRRTGHQSNRRQIS
jgi:hypothetical protein